MFEISFNEIIEELKKRSACKLTKIDLSLNNLSVDEFENLVCELKENKTLEELSLAYCHITSNAARKLFKAIENHTNLTKLDISDNEIGSDGLKALSQVISKNKVLEDISIENNGVERGYEDVFIAIAKALQINESIKSLCLRKNEITDGAAIAFSEMFKINHTLSKVDFSQTKISAFGAGILADGLKYNKSILSIDIESNNISEKSAQAFADMLNTNKILLRIDGLHFRYCRRNIDRLLEQNNRPLLKLAAVSEFQKRSNDRVDHPNSRTTVDGHNGVPSLFNKIPEMIIKPVTPNFFNPINPTTKEEVKSVNTRLTLSSH